MKNSRKITTKNFGGTDFHFYKGYDNEVAQNHPHDGSNGFVVFFVKIKNLHEVPNNLDHSYIVIHGVPDVFIGTREIIREYEKNYSIVEAQSYRVVGGSLEKRVFKIEVADIAEGDVADYVKKVQDKFKKTPLVNPATGQVSLKYNPINMSEDYYLTVRG